MTKAQTEVEAALERKAKADADRATADAAKKHAEEARDQRELAAKARAEVTASLAKESEAQAVRDESRMAKTEAHDKALAVQAEARADAVKKEDFLRAYIGNGKTDAAGAAVVAGYGAVDAEQVARKLMDDPGVKAALVIDAAQEEAREKAKAKDEAEAAGE